MKTNKRSTTLILSLSLMLLTSAVQASEYDVPVRRSSTVTKTLNKASESEKALLTSRRETFGRISMEAVVDVIIQMESGGDATKVGEDGARGLMQIREPVWHHICKSYFGTDLDFDLAFDPAFNRLVGTACLVYVMEYIHDRTQYEDKSLLPLTLAGYRGGLSQLQKSSFRMYNLPPDVQGYASKGAKLYEVISSPIMAQR